MTADDKMLAALARANPVPTDETLRSDVSGRDLLAHELRERDDMTHAAPTSDETATSRPRWPAYVAAAAVLLLALGLLAFIAGPDEPTEPATTIDPPATIVAPTTIAGVDDEATDTVTDDAVAVAERFVDALASSDLSALAELAGDGFLQTYQEGIGPDAPSAYFSESVPFDHFLLERSRLQAQGARFDVLGCEPADEQLDSGVTVWCEWEIYNAVTLAVDSAPDAEGARIVVDGDEVVAFHLVYELSEQTEDLNNAISAWMNTYHDRARGIVFCCTPYHDVHSPLLDVELTVDEAIARGEADAQWAANWKAWLDRWGCAPEDECQIPIERWVAEYDAGCTSRGDPAVPSVEFLDEMRLVPPPLTDAYEKNRLLYFDQAVIDAESDAEVAAAQEQRLAWLITLGIDEACHPAVD